jgi:hypothetical protein
LKIYFGNQKEWEGRPDFLTSNLGPRAFTKGHTLL